MSPNKLRLSVNDPALSLAGGGAASFEPKMLRAGVLDVPLSGNKLLEPDVAFELKRVAIGLALGLKPEIAFELKRLAVGLAFGLDLPNTDGLDASLL